MLIDKESKKMLRLLRSNTPDGPYDAFSFGEIQRISGMDEAKTHRITKTLVNLGCAEYARDSSKPNNPARGIALTQVGYKFNEYTRLEAVERWKERLLGFIMGAGATLIGVLVRFLLEN